MTTVRSMRAALAFCAIAACSGEPSTQVLTGRVDTHKGAVAIRAISDGVVITAAQVRTDGSFTLVLPAGARYRLEVLTRAGVKNVVARTGSSFHDLTFKVCAPTDPYDVGGIGDPTMCDPATDPNCKPGCEDPMDPNCQPPPPPCMDPTDPTCGCDANGNCPPPKCEPGDPNCTPCDPMTDPMCPPPPCTDPMDPTCCDANGTCGGGCTDPNDPNCMPPPCTDPMDPNCKPPCMDPMDPTCNGCDANGNCPPPVCMDPNDPGCAPPCTDPMDPTSCKDPCVTDPATCGCMMDDPNCWPQPEPCDPGTGMCDPNGTMEPDNVPGDFGCMGSP
jgi:hypothetical protein